MTKPEPLEPRRPRDDQRRATTSREWRHATEPEDAALQREIQRLRQESEEALAAYKRAFEPAAPPAGSTTPSRFP